MRRMTVGELKRYFEGRSFSRIFFCTDNQQWHRVCDPMNINMVFSVMQIACNPNIICLKNGGNMMYFERVKFVLVDQGRSPSGIILDVVCGDRNGADNDQQFRLLVS